jgi:perosamine synthetase
MTKSFPISQPTIGERELACVSDAVRSGWVSSLGAYIEEFEKRFAASVGTRYCLAVSNGTTGLHLALLAAGIKPGDEVIVPDLTFVASANSVVHAGAKPVLVDIDEDTLCISVKSIAAAITDRTRAIMPVHLYGHPCDMDPINELAARHGLAVIEDAAEAHGATYKGRVVGSLGKCGVFSFYGNKIVTCGEGGVITTDDPHLAERARRLRDHAMSPVRRYWHDEIGYNYRMTNLQAALGVAQLEQFEYFLHARREVLGWYRRHLAGAADLTLNREASWAHATVWMICVEVDGMDDDRRRVLIERLKSSGVDSRPYFYPISGLPMYAGAGAVNETAYRVAPRGLNLPCYVGMSEEDVREICRIFLLELAMLR